MLTEGNHSIPLPMGTHIFLFAHQDDEFGVLHLLDQARALGRSVVIAYLTRGAKGDQRHEQRNQESVCVLKQLGVAEGQICFAGQMLGIDDGALSSHLAVASDWLSHLFRSQQDIQIIYIPAWEGGHPDHDALHAACVHAIKGTHREHLLRQFPLYNAKRCAAPWFRVLAPLPENGATSMARIPWRRRWTHLQLMLSYPSQWKTWVGLIPFVFYHYVFKGTQSCQHVNVQRIHERPHEGSLYYEHRRFSTWSDMQAAVEALTTD